MGRPLFKSGSSQRANITLLSMFLHVYLDEIGGDLFTAVSVEEGKCRAEGWRRYAAHHTFGHRLTPRCLRPKQKEIGMSAEVMSCIILTAVSYFDGLI